MAIPSFSKTGVTTWQPTHSPSFPYVEPVERRQEVGLTEGDSVKANDWGYGVNFFRLIYETMSKTDRDALITFLEDAKINYSQFSFTYTDKDSGTHTVRFISAEGLDYPEITGDIFTVSILLRKQV